MDTVHGDEYSREFREPTSRRGESSRKRKNPAVIASGPWQYDCISAMKDQSLREASRWRCDGVPTP